MVNQYKAGLVLIEQIAGEQKHSEMSSFQEAPVVEDASVYTSQPMSEVQYIK